jgi:hypothetical protein
MILREYALEPTILSNWDRFQRFIGHFGVQHGRLISRFPSKWKKMVVEGLTGCGEIERLRIFERLRTIDDRLLPRPHDWNPNLSWFENVVNEQGARPFHAVIARQNPRGDEFVILSDELDETAPVDQWKPSRSVIVKREAQKMAAAVALLLKISRRIVLIDPHFGPGNGRHLATLEHFLAEAVQGRSKQAPLEVAVHCGDKSEYTAFEAGCHSKVGPLIPTGIEVRFIRWKQEQLHNRFILTDLGGVSFLQGLDVNQKLLGPDEDLIQLLDAEVCNALFDDYCGPTPKYIPGSGKPFSVPGQRVV